MSTAKLNTLESKTIIITGGSRGIGLAIGSRLAKAGANIVIMAKEEQHPDEVESAIAQITKMGAKALAFNVDVRDENAIETAITKTVSTFGGIDALINNVSAFCFTDTLDTDMEKFDLLFAVNVRATFLLAKTCIPHLKQAKNPHVINIAPPLEMDARWFKHHLAFTMSKYAMSMCTLGLAAEFKTAGIAVNSLWPQTTIATTTIENHFVSEVYSGSRWPTIMADAAYELLQKKARQCSGNFFIDETLLREVGYRDFESYAVDAESPLVQDLFVPTTADVTKIVHLDKKSFR